MEMKIHLVCLSLNGVKDSERDMINLKMIQVLDGRQMLEIGRVQTVRKVVIENRRLTLILMEDQLYIYRKSIRQILVENFGKSKI
jgi:hypothetical protein